MHETITIALWGQGMLTPRYHYPVMSFISLSEVCLRIKNSECIHFILSNKNYLEFKMKGVVILSGNWLGIMNHYYLV